MDYNFTVENAINSCYIDSLLMGLFFFDSNINILLDNYISAPIFYLQNSIRELFILKAKNNINIDFENIDTIRRICFELGWRDNNYDEYYEIQNIGHFYEFLIPKLNGEFIDIKKHILYEGQIDTEESNTEIIPYFPVCLDFSKIDNYMTNLLKIWMFDNPIQIKKKINFDEEISINGLCSYEMVNLPNLIAINVNRYLLNKKFSNNLILEEGINPINCYLQSNDKSFYWEIKSIICYQGNINSGHYYTYLYNSLTKIWYKFDDQMTPSIKKIDSNNNLITDINSIQDIKENSTFIIYRLIN